MSNFLTRINIANVPKITIKNQFLTYPVNRACRKTSESWWWKCNFKWDGYLYWLL